MKVFSGNAVVGQSGGPTAAINATLAGVIRGFAETAKENKDVKLYGMRNGIEGLMREDLIDLCERFADERDILSLETTPAAALGSCRKKLPKKDSDDETYDKIIGIFKKCGIRTFFYIGGNDSMDTVDKLSYYTKKCGYDMSLIGVPKTIDNDLELTDHTPGFGSAAKYIAVTVEEILRDTAVYTIPAVTIVEIMGRDAGWLTASSALGRIVGRDAPDLVYLPEVPFSDEEFIESIKACLEHRPNVVVAVSEGIRYSDGSYIFEKMQESTTDAFGHKQLSGTGKALELMVKEKLGIKVRSVELNIPQRCAGHLLSKTDIDESVMIGKEAVFAAAEGVSREMMIYERVSTTPYKIAVSHKDISEIANKVKSVPERFINDKHNNVTDECLEYLLPLIKGERYPEYSNGLPKHTII